MRVEETGKVADLINRRKILEQRKDHLMVIKSSRPEQVNNEPREIKFKGL